MHFWQSNLFGGQGTVEIDSLLIDKGQPFSAVLWCSLEVGGSIGKYCQQRDPEIILCISGKGEICIDSQVHSMTAKSLVYMPFGSVMSLLNTSETEPFVYVIVKAEVPT